MEQEKATAYLKSFNIVLAGVIVIMILAKLLLGG